MVKNHFIGEFTCEGGSWERNNLTFHFMVIVDLANYHTYKTFNDQWGRKIFLMDKDSEKTCYLAIRKYEGGFFILYKQFERWFKTFSKTLSNFSFWLSDEVKINPITKRWDYIYCSESSVSKKKLTLNLIPSTSWWKNARSEIPKSEWDRIRKQVYQKANYTCEICGTKTQRLDCNELWDYKGNQQILMGLEAICRRCHLTQHMGYASIIGKEQEAFDHLLKVNGWSGEWGKKYVEEKFAEWEVRSEKQWKLDLSYLTKHHGIKIEIREGKGDCRRMETGKRAESARSTHERKKKEKYQKMADEIIEKTGLKKDYYQWKDNQDKK